MSCLCVIDAIIVYLLSDGATQKKYECGKDVIGKANSTFKVSPAISY